MLAEVDEYCRAEDLLTLQRTPEQVRFQDWVCEEFVRQLRGEPPRPWTPRPALSAVPASRRLTSAQPTVAPNTDPRT